MATRDISHIELWIELLERSTTSLGSILEAHGSVAGKPFGTGQRWRRGSTDEVSEASPATKQVSFDPMGPALNHLAFSVVTSRDVGDVTRDPLAHGWTHTFDDRHCDAGGAR